MLAISEAGDKRTVALQSDLTIYQIKDVSDALLPQLSPDYDLEINLSEVNELDCSGVQLLMLMRQQSRQQATKLTIVEHSQAVLEVFDQLDLVRWFEDPIVLTGGAQ
ncbi:STAS domain-containing protein [Salinibius halmophilus]|uniref:STAS domain-containing protein n=1 Tax=Salinibius halmophilus TaxID=1853216 RepID=UPI000E664E3A|nr:STAS domain-containing protein [Salinibius halmophilus]